MSIATWVPIIPTWLPYYLNRLMDVSGSAVDVTEVESLRVT